jgi:hypothetical protein
MPYHPSAHGNEVPWQKRYRTMAALRGIAVFTICALTACATPSASERTMAAELSAVTPLKQEYAGVVSGFDIRTPETLTIALDLQRYMDMDDDATAALQRHALATWRTAWIASHPRANATLHVRFIDFIGRTVAVKSTPAR